MRPMLSGTTDPLPDVEEVRFEVIAAARSAVAATPGDDLVGSGGGDRRRHRDQHGELAKVLSGGGEVEFVAGPVWAA
jgi:hypothetical protein